METKMEQAKEEEDTNYDEEEINEEHQEAATWSRFVCQKAKRNLWFIHWYQIASISGFAAKTESSPEVNETRG